MRTDYSAIALGAMILVLNAAAAGVSEDRIPELQREARTNATSATLTGCVAQGVAAGTYILTNIIKDEQTNAKDGLVRTSVLLSSTDVDVSTHVGHRVSVTGVYLSHGRTTSVAAMDKPAPTEEIARGDKLTSATFRVKSLAMVADSCSQTADQSAAPNGKPRQIRAAPPHHAAYREIARRRYRFGPELSNGLREDTLEHLSEEVVRNRYRRGAEEAAWLAIVQVPPHSRQRQNVVTVIVFTSVSMTRPVQKGQPLTAQAFESAS